VTTTRRRGPSSAEIAELGIVLAAAWGSSLLPAPSALDSTARPWPTAVAVAMLGLFSIAAQRRWPSALDSARHGASVMIGCLVLALAGVVAYFYLVELWTCRYYAEARVTGAELTPFAAEYLRQEPATSCTELLKRFTGRADEIWTPASSLRRELTLRALHLGVVSASTVFALSAARLIARRQRRRMGPSPVSAPRASEPHGVAAGERLLPLALALSRLVLSHETILRHAQTALRAPELVEIPSPAHARSLWVAVLRRAAIEGVIPKLVDLVLDENPAADELRVLVDDWLPRELAPPRAPHPC